MSSDEEKPGKKPRYEGPADDKDEKKFEREELKAIHYKVILHSSFADLLNEFKTERLCFDISQEEKKQV